MKYIKLYEEYVLVDYITNIEEVERIDDDYNSYVIYGGYYGSHGTIAWQCDLYDSDLEQIYINSINNNPYEKDKSKSEKKGEGSTAIDCLFRMYPTINNMTYDDDSNGFWDAIGGISNELTRDNFYNYYNAPKN